jgi:hypothetical protein
VNRACHQFLAGSGFSENQHIGIRGGDLFDLVKHIFDFVASADDVFMVEFQLDLFLQVGSLGFELVSLSFLISAPFLNQFLKVSFIIFAFGHILDGQQNHIGLVALVVDPSGIQMHDLGADGFKVCSTSKS